MNDEKRKKLTKKTISRLEDEGLKPDEILDFIMDIFINYAQFILRHAVKGDTEQDFNDLKKEILDGIGKSSKLLEDFEFRCPTNQLEELLALLKDADKIPNAEMVKRLSEIL